uniref:Ionotropic glutamate receptor C-terminal domain-containing protein n=1 Tax=Phaseolus vulgaris TaxID=3885 RepID=V7B503_PHAVU|nr:hypothetical protein PHAVU_008G150400g [Phaseolus vulgaris]ESW12889.1 hypothetical protein PHAVU_008G150400g [Phaseolus vulgaris]
MSLITCFFVLQWLTWSRVLLAHGRSHCSRSIMSIGAVLDLSSQIGKHQKIAMEIAVQDFNRFSCSKLLLKIKNSNGSSAQAVASARSEQVSPLLPYFIQVGYNINLHMQCIAAIVGEYRWRKVTAIYEFDDRFSSDPGMLLNLSYSLRLVGSEIVNHVPFRSLSSLLDPNSTIENEFNSLKSKSNRVFLILQSSIELANLLFEKANQMGLMGKGSVWIIPDGIAGNLDSVNPSAILNMQGVIGFKTHFLETSKEFRRFKFKFRRRFVLEFPEEENINPSSFALQSYKTTWEVAQAARESQGKLTLKQLLKSNISRTEKLRQSSTLKIINVIGKSYRELASWSPALGFSKSLVTEQLTEMNTNSGSSGVLSKVYWPGGIQFVPKGWTQSTKGRKLKIGVPAEGAFTDFVNVEYDIIRNITSITGFSIDVFKAAVHNLAYDLNFDFVPFNGSYDEMVDQVYNKTLDAAVGDTSIMAYRYHLVDFSQPYVESGIDMVVTEQPAKLKETWIFLEAFTKDMWIMMAALHIFVGFVIWLIERQVNAELKGLGSMLWFLVTVIFYAHRNNEKFSSFLYPLQSSLKLRVSVGRLGVCGSSGQSEVFSPIEPMRVLYQQIIGCLPLCVRGHRRSMSVLDWHSVVCAERER